MISGISINLTLNNFFQELIVTQIKVCLKKFVLTSNFGKHNTSHIMKYRDFIQFPGKEVFSKRTLSADFQAKRPKICGKCAFTQNFVTGKSSENSVFYGVSFAIQIKKKQLTHLRLKHWAILSFKVCAKSKCKCKAKSRCQLFSRLMF